MSIKQLYSNLSYRLFKTFYALILISYMYLNRYFKPVISRYPRLYRFALQMKEAVKELIQPYPKYPSVVIPSVPMDDTQQSNFQDRLPEWLVKEWRAIHTIEPQLFPTHDLIQTIPFYNVPHSRIAEPYIELCELYGDNVSHVFLSPWLVRGGADLVTLNYIREIHRHRGDISNNIVVITTLKADSVWKKKLSEDIRFIEFGKKYGFLTIEEQEKLLTRLLLQMAPKVIHNINSELGYNIFIKYGNALKTVSNLYASSFCGDVSPEGARVGYPFGHLSECFEHLTAVLTDNQSHIDDLHRIYGLDKDKMLVHYQPAPPVSTRIQFNADYLNKKQLDILWAGRLDRQKRPDILIEIAESCIDLPFQFHVYGEFVIDPDNISKRFKTLENLAYHGSFDGLPSLPVEKYDLFLNTSQWDGVPNILLEAMSMGLPIISSDIGGISEIIQHDRTGLLINPYDDVEQYKECLQSIYKDRSVLSKLAVNAYRLLKSRHSSEAFGQAVRNIPGYFVFNNNYN